MTCAARCACAIATAFLGVSIANAQEGTGRPKNAPAGDEAVIRAAADQFREAFNRGDAEALAALYTEDARVVDEDGAIIEGRGAIRARFAEAFSSNPSLQVAFDIESVRLVTPDVAVEEGRARVTSGGGYQPFPSAYSAVYVKRDGGWKISQTRDHAAIDTLTPRQHLEQLAWMIGDWVDEADESIVHTTCAWSDGENFLVRSFEEKVGGETVRSGSQRIGWDAQKEQIRSWIFDSDGGFSEGLWSRLSENEWVVKVTGTNAAGDATSATNVFTRVHNDQMRWQSTERTIGGNAVPESELIVLARKPPVPAARSK